MKIEIKSVIGSVLYTTEAESIKDAVEKAVNEGVNLAFADLYSANLQFANLQFANLRSANLRSANLESANLRSADLRSADLESANLRYANLESANLRSADLYSANLRYANLRSADLESASLPIFCKWWFSYKNDYNTISIGCKTQTIDEWDAFFASDEVYSTPRDTEDFKRIKATYEALKAYCLVIRK